MLASVFKAASNQDFTASGLGIPGLRHFIYKSRTHVQLLAPSWEEPYAEVEERKRRVFLVTDRLVPGETNSYQKLDVSPGLSPSISWCTMPCTHDQVNPEGH